MKCVIRTLVCASDELSRAGLLGLLADSRYKATPAKGNLKSLVDERDGRIPLIIVLLANGASVSPSELQVLSQHFKIVFLADHCDAHVCHASLRGGASAYLPRAISKESLLDALDLVLEDKVVFPSVLAGEVLGLLPDQRAEAPAPPGKSVPADTLATLSARETAIVQRLVRGDSNKCISRDLNIADTTVKVHVKAILRKLGASNRTQAAIWGMSHLPPLPQPTLQPSLAPELPAPRPGATVTARSRNGAAVALSTSLQPRARPVLSHRPLRTA